MGNVARPKVHTDDLRDRLLDEAIAIVAERGIGALSVRDVAHAAGTSTTAVYSLFGNKEGLSRAVQVRAFESFTEAETAISTSPDAAADLGSLGTAYIGWALANPRLYELMFGDALTGIEPTPESLDAAARAIAPLRDGVARAIETGAFRQADVGTVAASLWAQVHGMAQLLLSGHYPADADPIAAGEAIIEGWRRGILPPDVEPLG